MEPVDNDVNRHVAGREKELCGTIQVPLWRIISK
jgi:hypothetical protein